MSEGHFSRSYDYDGGASLQADDDDIIEQQKGIDEDAQYEKWREDCWEELDNELTAIFEKRLNKEHEYYNTEERIIKGIKSYIECKEKYE